MRRYFIYFSYKGTAYHGWQYQPNGLSVQEVLIKALSTIMRTQVDIVGAGRTDAGVHAKLMVAHFDFDGELPESLKLVSRLNSLLPYDIAVSRIVEVQPHAHARFDAIARRYEYHVLLHKNVFKTQLATKVSSLNFDLMNQAAACLANYSDFTSFSKLHTDVKTNLCDLKYARWTPTEEGWVFTIEADRFLRNMVRAIVGTLFEVGQGKMSIEQFCQVIESKNRCKAGASVPAHGLYLVDVVYPTEIFI